jgi:cytochrome c-type biogenesis protein CcmF
MPVVARVLGVLGVVAVGFLAFLIFTSNPFERLLPAAAEGRDLNPLLQDPGMIIHPPMLYMGYVGFSVPFAFAIAALLEGASMRSWLRWTRPWTNVAWAFLTVGIALGSWWAYYELGWGGWWFWDPVENASFMPWLAGTALLHSQAVTEKRGSFAAGPCCWRSRVLAVAARHLPGAFGRTHQRACLRRRSVARPVRADFPGHRHRRLARAVRVARTGQRRRGRQAFAAGSRETLLLLNNLLLTTACAMVLLGTLYPLLADALELGKISVGPPYFAMMFLLLMAPLVLLLPFGPLTRWQREDMAMPLRMLLPWAALALVLGVATFFLAPQGGWKTAAGIVGATWVAAGTLRFLWSRWTMPGARLTREMWGMTLAHLGIAVFLIGALLDDGLAQQREVAVKPGGSVTLGQHCFVLKGVQHLDGPNYSAERGTVEVLRHCSDPVATLHPEKRSYRGGQVMSEVALDRGFTRDLYVALGEPLGEGAWALRVHVKPFVRWIWAGALLMALGGLVTATDKRFRARWDDGKPQGVRA